MTVQEDPEQNPERPWGPEDPKEDPDDPNKPENPDDPTPPAAAATFVEKDATNFKLGQDNQVRGIGNVIVAITCPKAIENLVVTIESENDEFIGIISTFGLTKPFDLANPGDLEEGLKGLGLKTGAEVKGLTYTEFDITGFMPLLTYDGKHTFTIAVTDTEGATSSEKIVLVY
ncbi:MAG: hypothetical protein K2L28_06625 [Muribaculaceae bacterium]|nr:hypothetical protein [Muribaculaceae bacterium]